MKFFLSLFLFSNLAIASNCNYQFHFGKDQKIHFDNFHSALVRHLKKDNKQRVSDLINYPLRINGKNRRKVKNAQQLKKEFSSIFTQKVKDLIISELGLNHFCKSSGLMLGQGDIWISNFNKDREFKIISIIP